MVVVVSPESIGYIFSVLYNKQQCRSKKNTTFSQNSSGVKSIAYFILLGVCRRLAGKEWWL